MVLCSLLDTAVGVNTSFHHKFCAALVKDFAQFHVTLCTTCMTTGTVCAVYKVFCSEYIIHQFIFAVILSNLFVLK